MAQETAPGVDGGYAAFISHASEDRPRAEEICRHLEAEGHRCWIAPRDVRPGEDYPEEIILGIERSKCLILVLSDAANKSKFVRAEVERASSKGKPIFPIRIEEVLPSRQIELFVSTKHWVDAWRGDLKAHTTKLVREIARDPDIDLPMPSAFRRRVWLRRAMSWGVGGAGAVGIAVLVAFLMRSEPVPDSASQSGDSAEVDLGPDTPPQVHFSTTRIEDGAPSRVTFSMMDGYTPMGQFYRVFDHDLDVHLYGVNNDNTLKRFFSAPRGVFKGSYQTTGSLTIGIREIPKFAVSCIIYERPSDKQREIAVQGFTVAPPQFGSFDFKTAGPPKAMSIDDGSGCDAPMLNYLKAEITLDWAKNVRMAAADPAASSSDSAAVDNDPYGADYFKPDVFYGYGRWGLHQPVRVQAAFNDLKISYSFDGSTYTDAGFGQRILETDNPAHAHLFLKIRADGASYGPFEYNLDFADAKAKDQTGGSN